MADDYRAGATVHELRDTFQVSRTVIFRVLREQGVKIRVRPLTSEQVDEAVRLYKAGLPTAAVGDRLGCDGTTAWKALMRRGVILRSQNDRSHRHQA